MRPDPSRFARAVDGCPGAAIVMAEAFRRVTTEEPASVLRQTGEDTQALLLEVARLRWRPCGEIFGVRPTGDCRWLQLHGAPPHRRERIASLLGCESRRELTAAAVHARLSARNSIGRRASMFTIEFPLSDGKGARVTT